MSDPRPPLACFDDDVIEAVARDCSLDEDELRALATRHQRAVRDLPGVEDIVYEWRSQFHQDPLLTRTDAVYVLVHRPHVWEEYVESLALDDADATALRSLHREQARTLVGAGEDDRLAAGEPMVLTRP